MFMALIMQVSLQETSAPGTCDCEKERPTVLPLGETRLERQTISLESM